MAANISAMSDASSPQAPPASADAERRVPAASFYRAETYRAEESIGYLMRRILDNAQALAARGDKND